MNRKIPATTVLVFAAASLMAGCGLFSSSQDRAMRNTPSFKEGYSDGCAAAATPSSNYREGPYRDQALYQSDSAYRAGWSSGFQACRPAEPSGTQMPGANPIGSTPPGH